MMIAHVDTVAVSIGATPRADELLLEAIRAGAPGMFWCCPVEWFPMVGSYFTFRLARWWRRRLLSRDAAIVFATPYLLEDLEP
jgi:hypothetical protein